MADTKTFKTRIVQKHDTVENWASAGEVVLLKGEIAIVEVPTEGTAPDNMQGTPPIMLMKVGDGETKFSELPYLTAIAGDVYSWAKAAQKPTYTATEISGLDTQISAKVEGKQDKLTFDGTYNADSNPAATKSTVDTAKSEVEGKLAGKQDTLVFADSESYSYEPTSGGKAITDKWAQNAITTAVNGLSNTYAAKTHTHEASEITDLDTKLQEKANQSDLEVLQGKISGLTGAMHFKGTAEEDPASMSEVSSYVAGDVVCYQNKEYVFTTSESEAPGKFVELGDTTATDARVGTLETWQKTAKSTLDSLATTYAAKTELTALETKLVGTDSSITASTIKAAAKEAETYTDSKISALGSTYATKTELNGKAAASHSHSIADLTANSAETYIILDCGTSTEMVGAAT